ncbi:hypothetical protein NOF55_06800 [Rhizobiaceae bacterium BDR2-2]|uniref:Tetratricopeptide repeat-containing protein n=1 Tax=Ectorhizobium quercum TaxID=2965071 RepID=A0AAE3MZZ5_9HYPH|nr:hypothetical protein [Ectorhizobium quercum]MCX8996810.1 hypothetical protein [Ectorhizobium quercum]
MRFLLSALFLLNLTAAAALAQTAGAPDAVEARTSPADAWPAPLKSQPDESQRIESLLSELRRERDPAKAAQIAGRLSAAWNDSGSATVNLLMKWADDAVKQKRNTAAFDFLDQATVLDPDHVGVWNKRAALNHVLGNDKRSMSDLNRVLIREPRHFRALSMMAEILESGEQTEAALKAWQRYLEIYPADRDAQKKAAALEEKLAGSRA